MQGHGRSGTSAMGEKAELSVEVTQPAVSCSWTKERWVLLVMSKAKRKWVFGAAAVHSATSHSNTM